MTIVAIGVWGAKESLSQDVTTPVVEDETPDIQTTVVEGMPPEVLDEKKAAEAGNKRPAVDIFKLTTKLKDPHSLRDPFKSPYHRQIEAKEEKKGDKAKFRIENGVFTDKPDISKVSVDQIEIVGVLVGKDRRAMARVAGEKNINYILREGMSIGDKSEIKAILPGGVVVVEKFINVYGQEEFLESILPVISE